MKPFAIPAVTLANADLVMARMWELGDDIWSASERDQMLRRAEYHELVAWNIQLHGLDVECGRVDPWNADCFSDLYKDRNGVRPRGFSYRYMKEWMDNIPPLDDERPVIIHRSAEDEAAYQEVSDAGYTHLGDILKAALMNGGHAKSHH